MLKRNINSRRVYAFVLMLIMLTVFLCNSGQSDIYAERADYEGLMLAPGGMTFGVQMKTDGVLVIGFASIETDGGKACPAMDSGVVVKDIIYAVNGKKIYDNKDITSAFESSGGNSVNLSVKRGDKDISVDIKPVQNKTDGKFKAGMCLRDSTAGIGTVTFINPQNMTFAGLGHGICDSDTGMLMPMLSASVCKVNVNSVRRGRSGAPGELKGRFSSKVSGKLYANTISGVCGVIDDSTWQSAKPIPVANEIEVKEGSASIFCTVDGTGVKEYKVRITDIENSKKTKNFTIELVDENLLAVTGGIVQGMSGSPVVQNGKLIGAVTHVTVTDPTRGYGIFIGNMLDSMYKDIAAIQFVG